ncbi:glyoxal reductase [Gigaspora rosea]|uniref:Glyoxal reductase n=1 Tax=Gigaspora rosea TaxID=44941 RepID=A0A397VXI9_9GLOM|nr:glyoxal reductase [Gigaspora rosea]
MKIFFPTFFKIYHRIIAVSKLPFPIFMINQRLSLSSTVTMNNSHKIPLLAIGMDSISESTKAPQGETAQNVILWALESGYRHIDTALLYGNEENIGIGIIKSSIPHDHIFITTKIWDIDTKYKNFRNRPDHHSYESTIMATETSLSKLQTSYIDLLLIHSPRPSSQKRIERNIRSIGVSNYSVKHLKELIDTNPEIIYVVNQIEVHPWNNRKEIISYCTEHKIILNDHVLVNIAKKYNKSAAQILICWCLQNNFVVSPKSTNKIHIIDNTKVYDFVIKEEDMKILDNLDEYLLSAVY